MTQSAKAKRTFSVSPHIIYSLISSQAGSLSKAVLECVMNSIDAGATELTIDVSQTHLRIVDNGKGFTTKEEIEKCFEVFGFDHSQEKRVYGQFGIGRAQLWNFCPTLWRTNSFSMDVDIKNKGLDYDLQENLSMHPGLEITGKLYEKLKTSELIAFEKELTELALYAQVPIILNGAKINKDPASESWTHETDDAWIKLKSSGELTVYNLGVKVRNFPSYLVGSGGVVVTKPNVRLALNMARNDIVTTECKVWKRIKPLLQSQSDERIKKSSTRLSEDEMQNLVMRFLTEEIPFAMICDKRVITDIQGKNYTLSTFLNNLTSLPAVTVAEKGNIKAERAHLLKYGFVLDPKTLDRFSVETVSELRDKLYEYFVKECSYLQHRLKDKTKFVDDYNEVCQDLSDTHIELPVAEQTREEDAILGALFAKSFILGTAMRRAGTNSGQFSNRTLKVGISTTANAWTDGRTRVVFNRDTLKLAKSGLPGVITLCTLLLHEYLHDTNDDGSHEHDIEFYSRFERTFNVCDGTFGEFCLAVFKEYLLRLRAKKLKILRTQLSDADLLDIERQSYSSVEQDEPLLSVGKAA